MSFRKSIITLAALAAIVPFFSPASADEPGKPQVTMVPGISTPKGGKPINLTFPNMGLMKTIDVKPGDVVKAGQELACEDTDIEEAKLVAMKIKAGSTAQSDAAKKDSESKKITADNMAQAFLTNSATFPEKEDARLQYEKSVIAIKYADEEHDQDQANATQQKLVIEKMKLISPVDGVVQKISIQPGELVDPNKPDGVLTIVANSTLWVDMHIQSAMAARLKVGDKLQASYDNDPDHLSDGTVIFLDPVVDAASDTQTVRLEVDNKEGKPSGLALHVRLPVAK